MTARALTLPRWWTRANKTEQAYYVTQLAPRLVPAQPYTVRPGSAVTATDLVRIDFQPETLLLGEDCRYTPDFRVVPVDGVVEFHEVKGPFKREDAIIKLRSAPSLHPYRFFLAELSVLGAWKLTEILAP